MSLPLQNYRSLIRTNPFSKFNIVQCLLFDKKELYAYFKMLIMDLFTFFSATEGGNIVDNLGENILLLKFSLLFFIYTPALPVLIHVTKIMYNECIYKQTKSLNTHLSIKYQIIYYKIQIKYVLRSGVAQQMSTTCKKKLSPPSYLVLTCKFIFSLFHILKNAHLI